MTITTSPLVVGTDGTPDHDQRVREAARLAHARNVPLHVVCCVAPATRRAQRVLDEHLPADMAHLAGASGQRTAAVAEIRSMLAYAGIDLRVTASSSRLAPAVRTTARRVDGQVYSARPFGGRIRLGALRPRVRTA